MTTTGTRVREDSDLGRIPGLVIFYIGCAVHLLFLVSLLTHWLDPLFFEATTDYGQASDYFGIYQAGDNLTQGRSIYLEGGRPEDSDRHVPYYYFYRYLPPTATFMALTALLLKPWPSYWVWVVINEALLGLTLFSLRRLRSPPSALRRALAGLTLGFSPLYLELWMGQFSLLMAVLLWVTFWPELRAGAEGGGRIPAAGEGEGPPESWPQAGPKERFRALLRQPSLWCWSASVALKNYPAFFAFPWLRLGRWRRVFLGAGLVALSCLPYFLLRPHDVGLYRTANFRRLSAEIQGGSFALANLIRALGWRLPSTWTGRILALGPMHVYAGNAPSYALAALLMLLSLYLTWRMPRGALPEALALWVLTFFLVHKEIWEYHYVMLLPVIWVLAVRGPWRPPLVLGLLLALPTPFLLYRGLAHSPVDQWPLGIVLCHYGSKVFPAIGLYGVAAQGCLRPPAPGPGSER